MPYIKVRPSLVRIVAENATGTEIYQKYKPDFMINGGLYDMSTGKTMTHITHDGINEGGYFSKTGIGFRDGRAVLCQQGEADNFVGGSPVILDNGIRVFYWGNTKSAYLEGSHIRSYIGITENGHITVGVTNKAVRLEELQAIALQNGCYHAINLDGGGSCYLRSGENLFVSSARKNANWILMWGEEVNKTNLELVEHCKKALADKWGYVWGSWGLVLTDKRLNEKAAQYPTVFDKDRLTYIRSHYMGKRVVDCGGLIKSFLWWDGTDPVYTPSSDLAVDTMYERAKEKGAINTIPEIHGLLVWHKGHVGVYIGNGKVIEARGTLYGVVETELSKRPFTHWFKHKDISYIDDTRFSDVAKDRWSYWDIEAVAQAGIIGGFSDGTFRPAENITREQIAAVINRLMRYKGDKP